MFGFLRNFELDRNSFWIGVIIGTLFWWLLGFIRPYLRRGWTSFREQWQRSRESLATGTQIRLANDTLRRVQRLHISAALFALDEIRIEPRVLAPPPRVEPGEDPYLPDVVSLTIPYTPDWPELAGRYRRRTFSLAKALSGGANLLLMGKPGMGKTFALADLASQMARQETGIEDLDELVPIYLHVFDINPEVDNEWLPQDAIIDAAGRHASTLTNRQLPKFIQSALKMGRVLLLLDGMDELPPDEFDEYADFIAALSADYPLIRMVVAVSTEYQGNLLGQGLQPVSIAAWDQGQKEAFIERWSDLWIRFVNPDIWPPEDATKGDAELFDLFSDTAVDPYILNGYLHNEPSVLTPLEQTLRVWGAYAGDLLGSKVDDDLEAYIRRMTVDIPTGIPAMEKLALRLVQSEEAAISRNEVDSAFHVEGEGHSLEILDDEELSTNGSGDPEAIGEESSSKVSVRRALSKLINAGLLQQWQDGRVSFFHPVVMGYLAGSSLARAGDTEFLLSQPRWIGRNLTLEFLAACGEISPLAMRLLESSKDPLQEELLLVASWLRIAPKSDNWRSIVMRRLAKMLQNEVHALSLRTRALQALAVSGDKDVATLFRHLIGSDQPNTRQLAALGSGFLRDADAVADLAGMIYDRSPNVCRASALALVSIGSEAALEQTASALLHGDEQQRRAAAEAFSNHPEEGHPILTDGAALEDLLVRRAVVYGLQRIEETWALDTLSTMQVDDEQWVVRNAATQALEELEKSDGAIPRPFPPLHELPWLIAFAGEKGMGITPGKPALEMLRLALRDGNLEQRLAALKFIHLAPDTGMIMDIYNLLYKDEEELREAAFQALWEISIEGIELPAPAQFGVG